MKRRKGMTGERAKAMVKSLTVAVLAAALAVPALPSFALAKDKKRDRKGDGTCKSLVVPAPAAEMILTKDQKRDRKRDGTCKGVVVPAPMAEKILAKDKKRDRKKDGTC